MWFLIFGSILLAAVAGSVYLCAKAYRFAGAIPPCRKKRWARLAVSIATVGMITLLFWLIFGLMNVVVIYIHLVLFWLIADAVCHLIKKIRKQNFRFPYAAVSALLFCLVYLSVGWCSSGTVWAERYTVDTPKAVGTLRIVQFADAHVGATFDGNEFAKHVQTMQEHTPDVVLITGDFVDDDTKRSDMVAACAALGRLQTTYGVFFSFGNHDKGYYSPAVRGYDGDDLIAELKKNNVTVLQDESVCIDDRFYIVGRQDAAEPSRESIADLTVSLDHSKYMIVLDHQPNDYANEADAGVDLVLSGHTHGGQFFPINRAGEWIGVNDRTYGHEQRNHTHFIVTSGISDWALWFKTGCKSEFTVIDICGEK